MIKVISLKSGIKLILDKMDSVKSVSIGIWCNNGSCNENPEEQGISHFIEHLLFKGTESRSAFQIVQEMDSIGAEINAFTSKQRTCFYAKCIDKQLFRAADVLADMIEHPLFDKDEIEREKLVVIEEINMNADDPDDVALETFDGIVMEGSKLSHPVLGTKELVSGFTRDFIYDYYLNHYTKDKIAVSVAGAFDEDELVSFFENRFSNLRETARCDEDSLPVGRIDNVEIVKDIEQAHLVLGLKTVGAADSRRYHLSLLSMIMGGGMSSRLFQNVREKKGLAYSVYSSNSFYGNTGEFGIVAGVAKDRVDEAIAAIKDEIDILDKNPISVEEYESAKCQLTSSYIFSLENTQSRMRSNGINYFALGKPVDLDEIVDRINSITLEDLEKSKKLISDFSKYTIVNVTGK